MPRTATLGRTLTRTSTAAHHFLQTTAPLNRWQLWLRFSLTPHIGPVTLKQLYVAQADLKALIEFPKRALALDLSAAQCTALAQVPDTWLAAVAQTELWRQDHPERFVLTLDDADYPEYLRDMADPPPVLFGAGHRHLLSERACIAIVGSRNPTAQGLKDASRFAAQLAQEGLIIVSGLALGIDGAAHEGALGVAPQTGPNTIAIVGTGLDLVYPRSHAKLATEIVKQGLMLSEFPLGTGPARMHFPKRNRLIAGVSIGTLVIEAAIESGSLITAQMATEMGREVFALPGSIHATQSKGCHALIKQGAKLVERAGDIMDELPSHTVRKALHEADEADDADDAETTATVSTPSPAATLLKVMGLAPISLDALVTQTQSPAHVLQSLLFELEMAGHVARMPGGQFQQIV